MIEKGKQLDEIYKSKNCFLNIFQNETLLMRDKLRKYCEILIFREPLEYGKKAEEILWRRVYYEIINIVKINKKQLKSNSTFETMYRLHLSSAFGYYNHLCLKFQTEFNSIIKLDGFLDYPIISDEVERPNQVQKEITNKELLKEVLIRLVHKFLICLGDLARYQIEYDSNRYCERLAYKYYSMSMILLPNSGTPLNKLGTLFGGDNYECDAAYYYLYCLSCTEPFLAARKNLQLLLIRNNQRYKEEKKNEKENSAENDSNSFQNSVRSKEIRRFIVQFLFIIESILATASMPIHEKYNTLFI
jgi:protein SMG5